MTVSCSSSSPTQCSSLSTTGSQLSRGTPNCTQACTHLQAWSVASVLAPSWPWCDITPSRKGRTVPRLEENAFLTVARLLEDKRRVENSSGMTVSSSSNKVRDLKLGLGPDNCGWNIEMMSVIGSGQWSGTQCITSPDTATQILVNTIL